MCPFAALSADSCVELLQEQSIPVPFYRLTSPRYRSTDGTITYNSKGRFDVHVLDENDNLVGELTGYIDENAYSFNRQLKPAFRRHGISSHFFQLFFKKHKPNRPVKGFFIGQNLEVFEDEINDGATQEEAVAKTAFFRSITKFGYTVDEIIYRPNDEDEPLTVNFIPEDN